MRSAVVLIAGLALAGCAENPAEPSGGPAATDGGSASLVETTQIVSQPGSASDPTDSSISVATPSTVVKLPTVGDPIVDSVEIGTFRQPVGLAVRPGDNALFIIEQAGRIVRFTDGESTVVADISERVEFDGEKGLLGLAFSRDASLAYLDYVNTEGNSVISELPVGVDGAFAVDRERILFALEQPYSNHNGGDLTIGPDGLLYIAFGDGGSGGDPERRADDPTSLFGSILRIDPTATGDQSYTIPADNPFADGDVDGLPGAPEVWAWGLRNPWRITFDPVTDDLWIADVGQNEFEEIDRVRPDGDTPAGYGADFGWSAYEGTERFNTDVDESDRYEPPVLTYAHGDDGCSISGGAVYRGTDIVELEPAYVYSDFCSGILWALDLEGGRNLVLMNGFEQVTAVRSGPDGEVYVFEKEGGVYRLSAGLP